MRPVPCSRLITVRCAGTWPSHTCTTGGSAATPVKLSSGEQRKRGKIRSTSVKPAGTVMLLTATGDLVSSAGMVGTNYIINHHHPPDLKYLQIASKFSPEVFP